MCVCVREHARTHGGRPLKRPLSVQREIPRLLSSSNLYPSIIGSNDGRCVQMTGTKSARANDSRLLGIPRSRQTVAITDPNHGVPCRVSRFTGEAGFPIRDPHRAAPSRGKKSARRGGTRPHPHASPLLLAPRTPRRVRFQHLACLEERGRARAAARPSFVLSFPSLGATPQKPPESRPVPYSIVLRVQPSASEGITDLLSASGCEHLITLEMLDPTEKSDTTLEPQD